MKTKNEMITKLGLSIVIGLDLQQFKLACKNNDLIFRQLLYLQGKYLLLPVHFIVITTILTGQTESHVTRLHSMTMKKEVLSSMIEVLTKKNYQV